MLRGFRYAIRGVRHCLSEERNFRIHTVAAGYVLILAPHFLNSTVEWAVLLLTIALVMGAEAVNTAIERAVDLACPKQDEGAAVAKDAAAGAVLLCSVGAVAVAICLFGRPAAWSALWNVWCRQWWRPLLLGLSIPAALWVVFRKHGKREK